VPTAKRSTLHHPRKCTKLGIWPQVASPRLSYDVARAYAKITRPQRIHVDRVDLPLPPLSERSLGTNVLWNLASLAFLAFAGLLLNFAIARFYGPAALGLFNIVFALYIFLSQLGVLGIHFSVLRYVSEHITKEPAKASEAVSGGILLVGTISTAVTSAALVATPAVEWLYPFDGIRTAWLAILPGLWCFAINKVLFAAVNGGGHMRAFAVLQALRYIVILASLAGLLAIRPNPEWIVIVITFSEALLLPVLFGVVNGMLPSWNWRSDRAWIRTHLDFGLRVFLSGTISELNSRVDILLVGLLLDSTRVGVYSIALLLAEGFAQIIVVMRNNINPLITQYLLVGATDEFAHFVRRLSGWFALFMLVSGTGIVLAFTLMAELLLADASFKSATWPLAILVGGLVLASPYMPFGMILSQTDRPFQQTLLASAVLGSNVVFNLILVPTAGIIGAAVGTALSYVMTALLLSIVMRKTFGVRLWI
jgi:stage V sporulation protein B